MRKHDSSNIGLRTGYRLVDTAFGADEWVLTTQQSKQTFPVVLIRPARLIAPNILRALCRCRVHLKLMSRRFTSIRGEKNSANENAASSQLICEHLI